MKLNWRKIFLLKILALMPIVSISFAAKAALKVHNLEKKLTSKDISYDDDERKKILGSEIPSGS